MSTQSPSKLNQVRFWPLLAVLLANLLLFPLAYLFFAGAGRLIINFALWSAGIFAVSRNHVMLIFAIVCMLVITSLNTLLIVAPHHLWIVVIFHLAMLTLIGGISFYILREVFNSKTVTLDTILGSICVYLFLGIFFAALYSLSEELYPDSFRLPGENTSSRGVMTWVPDSFEEDVDLRLTSESYLLYFSFTTLTTLGYGDIAPKSTMARVLSSVQAVLGQLYLAVLVARLVAIARPMRHPDSD